MYEKYSSAQNFCRAKNYDRHLYKQMGRREISSIHMDENFSDIFLYPAGSEMLNLHLNCK